MKKALPLALVVAMLGTTVTASPTLPLRMPDAAATQADDTQSPDNVAYKAWKDETDPAKKFDLGKKLVSQFFGSKAAEAVSYEGLFKDEMAGHKLDMSYTYITSSNANGNSGQYIEYAYGNTATVETDPKKLLENAKLYLQKYPTGRYAPHITKNVLPPTRYAVFSALLKAAGLIELGLKDALPKDGLPQDGLLKDALQIEVLRILALRKEAPLRDALLKEALRKETLLMDALLIEALLKEALLKELKYNDAIQQQIIPKNREVFVRLKELKYNDAIQIANEAFASNENEFLYSYVLTDTAIRDLLSNGAKSQFVGKAEGWAERAAKFIESGQTPAGADPKKWEADKPTSLSLLYKAQGLSKYFATAQTNPKATDAYDPSIALMKKALQSNEKDPVTHFFLGQICDAQNVIFSAQFDALAEDQKTADAGNALTAKVNEALDCVINHYLRVTAYAGKNQALADTVKPRLVDLWKYRHEAAPDAWMDEVKKIVP